MLARRTKRRFLLVPILALGLVTMGMGSPAHADPSCASLEVSLEPGPTDIKAHGTTHFGHTSGDFGDLGGGQLTWALRGKITGDNTDSSDGDLSGFLEWTIDWDDGNLGTTSYSSFCVVEVATSVGHLLNGTYGGNITNPPPRFGNGDVAQRPQGDSISNFAEVTVELDRVSPRRADLNLDVRNSECFSGENFHITRNNAQALGDKTGNGARIISGCLDGD